MVIRYAAVALGFILVVAAVPASAQQPLPNGFFGQFRGTLSDGDGRADGEFAVTIRRTSEGFAVSWPPRISASFEPAGRPGVFRTRDRSKILRGDPVYWARIEGGALMVYSAQISEHGGYIVDSFQYTVSPDGLDLVTRQVLTGAEPRHSNGRLTRYGG